MNAPAVAAAAGLVGVAVFQLAIVLGAPVGRASWGGTHDGPLPKRLRVISGVAVVVWTGAALLVLRRGGLDLPAIPVSAAHWATWILAGLMALSALLNAASSSPWERYFWAPYVVVLAGLCFLTATS